MKKCPYNGGYECPFYLFGTNSCGNTNTKCFERGTKIKKKKKLLTKQRNRDMINTSKGKR